MSDSLDVEQRAALALVRRYPTPLRYPGGKQQFGPFFSRLIALNRLARVRYVEPFAGGAGVGLYLLQRGLVDSICLNDLDRAIYAFWYAATRRNKALCRMIERTPITVDEWDRQKDVQRNKAHAPLLELGFSTLFLNRTNRSGILRGGIVGGRRQNGRWLIDARFNRANVLLRIAAIRSFAPRISLACMDAVEFMRGMEQDRDRTTLIYLDPPYFLKGKDLYLNRYGPEDHACLAAFIKKEARHHWVLTYDDVPSARSLYRNCAVVSYQVGYSADTRRTGREIMLRSGRLRVPPLTNRSFASDADFKQTQMAS